MVKARVVLDLNILYDLLFYDLTKRVRFTIAHKEQLLKLLEPNEDYEIIIPPEFIKAIRSNGVYALRERGVKVNNFENYLIKFFEERRLQSGWVFPTKKTVFGDEIVRKYIKLTKDNDPEDARTAIICRKNEGVFLVTNDHLLQDMRGFAKPKVSYPIIIDPLTFDSIDFTRVNSILTRSYESNPSNYIDRAFRSWRHLSILKLLTKPDPEKLKIVLFNALSKISDNNFIGAIADLLAPTKQEKFYPTTGIQINTVANKLGLPEINNIPTPSQANASHQFAINYDRKERKKLRKMRSIHNELMNLLSSPSEIRNGYIPNGSYVILITQLIEHIITTGDLKDDSIIAFSGSVNPPWKQKAIADLKHLGILDNEQEKTPNITMENWLDGSWVDEIETVETKNIYPNVVPLNSRYKLTEPLEKNELIFHLPPFIPLYANIQFKSDRMQLTVGSKGQRQTMEYPEGPSPNPIFFRKSFLIASFLSNLETSQISNHPNTETKIELASWMHSYIPNGPSEEFPLDVQTQISIYEKYWSRASIEFILYTFLLRDFFNLSPIPLKKLLNELEIPSWIDLEKVAKILPSDENPTHINNLLTATNIRPSVLVAKSATTYIAVPKSIAEHFFETHDLGPEHIAYNPQVSEINLEPDRVKTYSVYSQQPELPPWFKKLIEYTRNEPIPGFRSIR